LAEFGDVLGKGVEVKELLDFEVFGGYGRLVQVDSWR
jgi:hypothetical protein